MFRFRLRTLFLLTAFVALCCTAWRTGQLDAFYRTKDEANVVHAFHPIVGVRVWLFTFEYVGGYQQIGITQVIGWGHIESQGNGIPYYTFTDRNPWSRQAWPISCDRLIVTWRPKTSMGKTIGEVDCWKLRVNLRFWERTP